jgi:hypothetical protein
MRAISASAKTNGRTLAAGVAVVVIGLLGAKSMGYLAFVGLALLPTFAAAILEKPGMRSATVSIGSMTTATLFPLVLGAIAHGSTRDLLGSVQAWAFIGCAVVGGAVIYFVVPIASVWVEDMRAAARLRDIRLRQQKLERDWGADVRVTPQS